MLAFNKLGYRRQITLTFEDLVDQPIWLNPHVKTPQKQTLTFEDFNKNAGLNYNHIYHIGELFTNYTKRDRNNIIKKPICAQGRLLSPQELNHKYQTNIPLAKWQTILDALPTQWVQTISQGNQTPIHEHYYATNSPQVHLVQT